MVCRVQAWFGIEAATELTLAAWIEATYSSVIPLHKNRVVFIKGCLITLLAIAKQLKTSM